MGESANERDEPASALRDIILAQSFQEVGIPVLLFTAESLGAAEHDPATGDPALPVMAELGLDPAGLVLFSADAYLVQTALGARLLPERP